MSTLSINLSVVTMNTHNEHVHLLSLPTGGVQRGEGEGEGGVKGEGT